MYQRLGLTGLAFPFVNFRFSRSLFFERLLMVPVASLHLDRSVRGVGPRSCPSQLRANSTDS